MKRSFIYNLSHNTHNVKIGEPVNRTLTITPGNHAWFVREDSTRIYIEASGWGMFLLPTEENVIITDYGIGSNLTIKVGKVENRATYPISVKGTIIPPRDKKDIFLSKGEIIDIYNAARRTLVEKLKIDNPGDNVIFDGISAYNLRV